MSDVPTLTGEIAAVAKRHGFDVITGTYFYNSNYRTGAKGRFVSLGLIGLDIHLVRSDQHATYPWPGGDGYEARCHDCSWRSGIVREDKDQAREDCALHESTGTAPE